jgi:hypothetical protein
MFREEERNNRSGSTEQRRDQCKTGCLNNPGHRRYIAKCKEKPPGYSIDPDSAVPGRRDERAERAANLP